MVLFSLMILVFQLLLTLLSKLVDLYCLIDLLFSEAGLKENGVVKLRQLKNKLPLSNLDLTLCVWLLPLDHPHECSIDYLLLALDDLTRLLLSEALRDLLELFLYILSVYLLLDLRDLILVLCVDSPLLVCELVLLCDDVEVIKYDVLYLS